MLPWVARKTAGRAWPASPATGLTGMAMAREPFRGWTVNRDGICINSLSITPSGARPNQVMSAIAERLTEYEMEAVSAYYGAMPTGTIPKHGDVEGTRLQWGGQLAAVGSAEKGIPACVNCHGPSGTGLAPSVPYLAGQYASYMALQLELWKEGVRDNDAMNVMSSIARKMDESDMDAVAEYYARVTRDGAAIDPDMAVTE